MADLNSQPVYRVSTVQRGSGADRATGAAAPGLKRSCLTRIIHFLLLLVVLPQLIGSQFIERPFPGDSPAWPYVLHEYVGLGGLIVVAAFWLWTLLRRGETQLGKLLPWFSIARITDVIADMTVQARQMMNGKVPDRSEGALASAVHGLGLLTATAMAMSGAIFFIAEGTQVAHTFLELHKLMANLMWAYLFAHAGTAVLHQAFAGDILPRMFWGGR